MKTVPCTTCNKPIKLRPCRVGQFKKNYCDNACRVGEKYSWYGYLFANMRFVTCADMAAHIGIPKPTLRTWAFLMNKDLPSELRIRFTKIAKTPLNPIKVGRVKKEKPIKVKPPKIKQGRKSTTEMFMGENLLNRNPDKVKTKQIDMNEYRYVRIDSKTLVLRKKEIAA